MCGSWPGRATLLLALAVAGGLLGRPSGAARAQPPLQVFGAFEQHVAAVGEPLRLDVAVYATVPPRALGHALAAALERALAESAFAEPLDGLTHVRSEPIRSGVHTSEGGALVVRAVHRLILRADRAGALTVPAVEVRFGGTRYRTRPYALDVYRVAPVFFDALRSVVPIVAEHVRDGRRYERKGTAFVAGPDRLVTSLHVVLGAREVRATLGARAVVLRHAWTVDAARDVVVLRVRPRDLVDAGLVPLALAPAATSVASPLRAAAEGEEDGAPVVFTAGWPGGAQRTTAGRHFRALTFQPGRQEWVTGNPVRPGDSGGPLLDARGRVLGVVTAGAALPEHADVLSTEMSVATDPRPALLAADAAPRPQRLHRIVRRALRGSADGAVLRVASELADRGGAHRTARDALGEALVRYPDDARLRFMEGILHRTRGDAGAAEEAFRRTLALDATYFPATFLLGQHLLARRAFGAAALHFEAARRVPPYEALSVFGLAQVALRRLEYDAARRHLETFAAGRPDYAPGLFALALAHLALGDEAAAREVQVHLRTVDGRWAGQLRQVLRRPALRPLVRATLPPADLRVPLRVACPRAEVVFPSSASHIPRCP